MNASQVVGEFGSPHHSLFNLQGFPYRIEYSDTEVVLVPASELTVSGVTATPPVISDSVVGNGTFNLALQFSKPMDASVTPELTFPTAGENPVGTITFASGVWSNGNQTYTATFNVTDMNMTIPDIDVRISNARDTLGNTLVAVTVTDVFSVDTENPRVASILRDGANPTSAASVQFLVTFTEPVNNVDAADFALALDGITGASITGITGTGANRTVTVSTGSGDGTIGLGLAANPTISDLVGNPLQNTTVIGDNETYTINRSAPTVTVTATPPVISDSAVGNGTFNLALQFSKPMDTSVTPELTFPTAGENPVGTITFASGVWSNGNQSYTATFNVTDLNVTIPDIDVRISNARDTFGNSLATVTVADVFNIDTENPRVASIRRGGAGASSVQFLVTFTEPVTGVDTSDFSLNLSGITGASITSVSGEGTSYTVTVVTGSGDGTVGLVLAANPMINDLAGNPLLNAVVLSEREEFAIKRSAPTVVGTYWGRPLVIDLLHQVVASQSVIDPDSVVIVSEAEHGTVTVLGDGRVRYDADNGFVGEDAIAFTLHDVEGRTIILGSVMIRVVNSPLNNPLLGADVDNNGVVSPFDALLVINALNRAGAPSVAVEPDALAPPYLDVNGDGRISAVDALMVINVLNRLNRAAAGGVTGPQGESRFPWRSEDDRLAQLAAVETSLHAFAVDRVSAAEGDQEEASAAADVRALDWVLRDWQGETEGQDIDLAWGDS